MKTISRAIIIAAAFLFSGFAPGAAEGSPSGGIIAPDRAKALLDSDPKVVLLDVRTKEEYATGHIPAAVLLPYDVISEKSAKAAIPSKDSVVIVYCRSGRRSAIAADTLRNLGYRTVWDLGGINRWPYEIVR